MQLIRIFANPLNCVRKWYDLSYEGNITAVIFFILPFFHQPTNHQRALYHQVIGPCKPCSDPNLSVADKGMTGCVWFSEPTVPLYPSTNPQSPHPRQKSQYLLHQKVHTVWVGTTDFVTIKKYVLFSMCICCMNAFRTYYIGHVGFVMWPTTLTCQSRLLFRGLIGK